jgi:hypothetical protein
MSAEPKTITFGGREFEVKPLPWGRLRRVMGAINRVGMAAAVGLFDDSALDDMSSVLCEGFDLKPEELEAMPTNLEEAQAAFEAIVQVSGLEQVMEKALGEARRAVLTAPLANPDSTPGTPSTPT